MTDRYKGESPGKKLGRLWAHQMIQYRSYIQAHKSPPKPGATWPGADPGGGYYLMLASRECGDAAVLQGLGVPSDRVFLVERNREAFAAAKERLSFGRLIHADVESAAFDETTLPRRGFHHIFLDFCNAYSPTVSAIVFRVAKMLSMQGGHVSVGVAYGRTDTDHLKGQSLSLGNKDAPANMRIVSNPANARARSMFVDLNERAARFGAPVAFASPTSLSYSSGHTPMVILQTTVWRSDVPPPDDGYLDVEAMREAEIAHHTGRAAPEHVAMSGVRTAFGDNRGVDGVALWKGMHVPGSRDDLIWRALTLEERNPGTAHLLLNIPRSQVAAWKALQTRGTYVVKDDGRVRRP